MISKLNKQRVVTLAILGSLSVGIVSCSNIFGAYNNKVDPSASNYQGYNSIAATGITLNSSTLTIGVGASKTITATLTPSESSDAISWSSSAISIATVSSSGVVTGVAVGAATITAKTASGVTATCNVTVTPNNVSYTGTVTGHTLSSNETWSGDLLLTGSITIPSGYTLTVKPGTIVGIKSGNSTTISVETGGTLSAIGTSSNPIVFRSSSSMPNSNDWDTIGASGGKLVLNYCIVQDAEWGVFILSSSTTDEVNIDNCCFNNCTTGICGYGPSILFTHDTLADCNYGFWSFSGNTNSATYCVFANNTNGIISSLSYITDNVSYCNFSSNVTDFEVFGSSSSSSYVYNNIINANYCYPSILTKNIYGAYNSGCAINVTNGRAAAVSSAGCGFSYSAYARSLSSSVSSRIASSRVSQDELNYEMERRAAERSASFSKER
jgi:hypothetical protein